MHRSKAILFCLLSAVIFHSFNEEIKAAEKGQLVAVLFYKSGCPECRILLDEILPQSFSNIKTEAGILAVNNSSPKGSEVYLEFLFDYNLPSSLVPPILITEKNIFSGIQEIKKSLPSLLDSSGILAVPENSSLEELIGQTILEQGDMDIRSSIWIDRNIEVNSTGVFTFFAHNFKKDPVANGLAVVVLIGMIVSLLGMVRFVLQRDSGKNNTISVVFPILNIIAFFIAFYLFYSGINQSELSCGPVGECNAVQQSEFAKIFGLVPVSLLGMLSYLLCLSTWIFSTIGPDLLKNYATFLAWGISSSNVLFFIYLTFLEPFIIGATCIWCISSAILTTLATYVAVIPARTALSKIT